MTRKEIITYFTKPGEENTDIVLELAHERAISRGIKDIIVASTRGKTALRALDVFNPSKFNLIIVTHSVGFKEPGFQEFSDEIRDLLIERGAKVLTSIHALSGVERAIRKMLNTWGPVELMAQALRVFGEGAKVAIEITVMAADAGLISIDRDVIAIGGTGKGADSAFVIKPANSSNFFDLFVKEIICKPLYHF